MALGDQFHRHAPASLLSGEGRYAWPDAILLAEEQRAFRLADDANIAGRLLAGEVVETGRRPIATSPYSTRTASERRREREEERKERLFQALLLQLQETLDDLYAQRADLYERLTEIHDEQAELVERMEALDASLAQHEATGERLARDGLPDRHVDGQFDDEALETILHAYEARTGNTVDRTDLSDVRRVVGIETRLVREDRAATGKQFRSLDAQARDVSEDIQNVDGRIADVREAIERRGESDFEERAKAVLQRQPVIASEDSALPDRVLTSNQTARTEDIPSHGGFGFGGGG